MSKARDSNGRFVEMETVESNKTVEFQISEFECRTIGNRLHKASELLKNKLEIDFSIDQDCRYWASRFLQKVSSREKDNEYYEKGKKRHPASNYHIQIKMTHYEVWSLGNKLFAIGELFEREGHTRVATETKWLGRRFHAEQNKTFNNENE